MKQDFRRMSHDLSAWFLKNQRNLPWRASKDPYRIWISEIMLQQTGVQVVLPYFERFLEHFPTASDLAEARESAVLALWSGLGYYSRARSLHKAAKLIAQSKRFPSTFEEWLEIPGVGPYTAAAIASIAYSERIAVVDGNVQRVLSRLLDLRESPYNTEGKKLFFKRAQEFLSDSDPGTHNQAVMELGATVCTPHKPVCLICPLALSCRARKNGTIPERPFKKPRRQNEPWIWEMYIAQKGDRIALTQQSPAPWLKGLWLLPGRAHKWTGSRIPEHSFQHQITHHKIYVRLKSVIAAKLPVAQVKWISKKDLGQYGLSSVVKKALAYQNPRKQ